MKSLGVILDKRLFFDGQVKAKCYAIHYHSRSLCYIRQSLPGRLAETFASCVVLRLDYCNSLLVGTSKANRHMLQTAQNTVARVVTRTKWCEHIQPVLFDLHWLPVIHRISFKVAALTFKIRKTGEPAYLATLIRDKGEIRSLRSSNKCYLEVPRRRTETAKRSFSYAAPSVWNSLPYSIRQLDPATVSLRTFKKQLKTYFFHLTHS